MKELDIVGPCAAESQIQVIQTGMEAQRRGIHIVRASLWKPRTRPGGFEGVKEAGIPWLAALSVMGMTPATEVLTPQDADAVINGIRKHSPSGEILLWLGARNQNHKLQQQIGESIQGDLSVKLMIKNPLWPAKDHWIGIVDHVLKGGADRRQLLLNHRGFALGSFAPDANKPENERLRNTPDWEMALAVKEETGLPLIADPSHIGGRKELVIFIAKHTRAISAIDGMMLEVHPNPTGALTDAKQQLTWQEADDVLNSHVLFEKKAG